MRASDPEKQSFSWQWTGGMPVAPQMLGDFSAESGIQICVFDGNSEALSEVLFETYWNAFDGEWQTGDWASFSRSLSSGKREKVTIEPDSDGESQFRVSGFSGGLAEGTQQPNGSWGTGLPLSPFSLPLRIQATVDRGGACFESTFDSTGVRNNGDGIFKGKAAE